MNLSTIILPITGAATGLLAGAIMIGPFLKMLASPVSSDDVAGKIVELGNTETLFTNPQHPYTQALLGSAPLLSRLSATPD